MPRPYSNKLRWRVITHYDYTQSSFWFQYQRLTLTTLFETALVYYIKGLSVVKQYDSDSGAERVCLVHE